MPDKAKYLGCPGRVARGFEINHPRIGALETPIRRRAARRPPVVHQGGWAGAHALFNLQTALRVGRPPSPSRVCYANFGPMAARRRPLCSSNIGVGEEPIQLARLGGLVDDEEREQQLKSRASRGGARTRSSPAAGVQTLLAANFVVPRRCKAGRLGAVSDGGASIGVNCYPSLQSAAGTCQQQVRRSPTTHTRTARKACGPAGPRGAARAFRLICILLARAEVRSREAGRQQLGSH
jgi:hypothetical protein